MAAKNGYLNIIIFVYQRSQRENIIIEVDEFPCMWAAIGGHLNCLKYLHENNFTWDYKTIKEALAYGNFECFKYAIENGCEPEINCDHYCEYAIFGKNLDCLKYLREHTFTQYNFTWNEYTFAVAAKYGKLEFLIYMYENGCPFNNIAFEFAKKENNLDCMKYLETILSI